MLKHYKFTDCQIRSTSIEMRSYYIFWHKKDYCLLRSAPAIGQFMASKILAEIVDLRRYKSFKKISRHIGIPKEYSAQVTIRFRWELHQEQIE